MKTIIPSTKITISENNVLAVIGDQKLPVLQGGVVVSFEAHVISSQDYSPFGVALSGRSWSAGYRYGFNGMEKEDDTFEGAYDFGARILDVRLGRWLSVDPKSFTLCSQSTYTSNGDNPLYYIDPEGQTIIGFLSISNGSGKISRAFRIATESGVFSDFLQQFNKIGNGDQVSSDIGKYAGINVNFEISDNMDPLNMGLNVVEVFDSNKNEWVAINSYEEDITQISKDNVRMTVLINSSIDKTSSAINTLVHETILHGESTAEMLSSFIDATSDGKVDLRQFKEQYSKKVSEEVDHYKILNGLSQNYVKAQQEVTSFLSRPDNPENTITFIPKTEIRTSMETYFHLPLTYSEKRDIKNGILPLSVEFKYEVHYERNHVYNPACCRQSGNQLCPKNSRNEE